MKKKQKKEALQTEVLETVKETAETAKEASEIVKTITETLEAAEESKAVTEVVEESKAVTEATEDSKAVTEATEESKAVTEVAEDSKAVTEAMEDSKAATEAAEDSKTVTEAAEDSKAATEAAGDLKVVAETTKVAKKAAKNKKKKTKETSKEASEEILNEMAGLKKAAGAEEIATITEAGTEEAPPQKSKKKKIIKYILIVVCLLLAVSIGAAIIAYRKAMEYYQTRFLPNTSINGIDCSEMEVEPIVAMLNSGIDGYSFEVTGRDYSTGDSGTLLGRIVPEDIQLTYEGTRETVEAFLEQQDTFRLLWRYLNKESASYTLSQNIIFDRELLESTVKAWDACQKGNMQKAEDAYISGYSKEDNCYTIIPETIGTEFDVDKMVQLVYDAVSRQETSIDIEELGCYQEASVKKDDKKLTDVVNTLNNWLGASIVYDWNGTEVKLDYNILQNWISIEKGKAVLDEEKVAEFVKSQAASYDTYGKSRKFKTTLGVELTISRSNYGWKTDVESETEELLKLIYQGSTVKREPVYSSTAKKKGISDIGNSYVEADLTHQHLYLYQNGQIVLETDFVSGSMSSTPDCVTPEGVFALTWKTTNRILRGATYESFVYFWMPFYGNYGMHDATWRSEFGGDIYIANGSHGCINLPYSMAEQIYQYVSTGFPVICYYYDVDPLAGQNQQEPEEEWEQEDDWDDEDE